MYVELHVIGGGCHIFCCSIGCGIIGCGIIGCGIIGCGILVVVYWLVVNISNVLCTVFSFIYPTFCSLSVVDDLRF